MLPMLEAATGREGKEGGAFLRELEGESWKDRGAGKAREEEQGPGVTSAGRDEVDGVDDMADSSLKFYLRLRIDAGGGGWERSKATAIGRSNQGKGLKN